MRNNWQHTIVHVVGSIKGQLSLFFIIVFLINFTGCSGCPYSFSGASVPPHLKSLAIPFTDDKSGSGEPNLRETLSRLLTEKFIQDNSFVITDRSNADALLECAVVSITDYPAVVASGENVEANRITIAVQAVYRDLVMKKTVYERQFSGYTDYAISGGINARSAAIDETLTKITEDIVLETVSGW